METNPTERKPGWTIASVVVLASNMFGLAILTITTTLRGPAAAEMYREMNIPLPQITTIMLYTISPSAYLGIWGAIAVGLLAKEFLIRDKMITFIINIAVVAFALIFLAVHTFAIFSPMTGMIRSMGRTAS